jgi:hypothetical protein
MTSTVQVPRRVVIQAQPVITAPLAHPVTQINLRALSNSPETYSNNPLTSCYRRIIFTGT